MSERSLTRAHRRRAAAAARRASLLRRRAGLVAGAAAGATAVFAPGALAATFEVNSLIDASGDACGTTAEDACTLRDAINAANTTDGADTITFASGLTGTIRLTQGELVATAQELTITGPGAAVLTVSGDADEAEEEIKGESRILRVDPGADVTLSGLTLADGFRQEGSGPELKYGGGAASVASGGELVVRDAVVRDSAARTGGGLFSAGTLTVERSTLSGNTATQAGGAIARANARFKYNSDDDRILPVGPLVVRDSVITDNEARNGAGVSFDSDAPAQLADRRAPVLDAASSITSTTIDRNDASRSGAGVSVGELFTNDPLLVSRSAITGNTVPAAGRGGSSAGGGLAVDGDAQSAVSVVNSTLAGNTADVGGGIGVSDAGAQQIRARAVLAEANLSPLTLDASTVTGNTARSRGGGFDLGRTVLYDDETSETTTSRLSQPVGSTVVAGNTAADSPGDLGQAEVTDPSGDGFVLSHSLVQTPGAAPVLQDPAAPSILGVDPLLGALADNGGPTRTQLPSAGSPLLDAAASPAGVTVDQRGLTRTVDLAAANATNGDGTDIGAVERATPAPTPEPEPTTTTTTTAPPTPPPAVVPPRSGALPASTIFDPIPTSRPKKPSPRRQPITLRGRASVGTVQVRVAVARKTRGLRQCRFLRADGTFAAPRDCRRTSYLTATGTRTWRLKLPVLAKGKYIIWSRALTTTKIERKTTQRNFTRLEIG